jgi:hypothetical protein
MGRRRFEVTESERCSCQDRKGRQAKKQLGGDTPFEKSRLSSAAVLHQSNLYGCGEGRSVGDGGEDRNMKLDLNADFVEVE